MLVLFVLLPVWFGLLWVVYLDIKGACIRFCSAWVLGLVSMFALGQILLVPMILTGKTLTQAINLWKILLAILSVVEFILLLKRQGNLAAEKDREKIKKKIDGQTVIFAVLAAVLIFTQAWISYHYQHIDDDDARFVSEEVSAVVHDTMLVDDPITDEYMYWDVGEVRKDVTSPWTMYVSM